jgi:hypothetical protein
MKYESRERMDFLTVGRIYIQRREKNQEQTGEPVKTRMNKEIVAQRRLSQQENCVERPLGV